MVFNKYFLLILSLVIDLSQINLLKEAPLELGVEKGLKSMKCVMFCSWAHLPDLSLRG